MKFSRTEISQATRRARRIVFPKTAALTRASMAAWADSAALWSEIFAPFKPLMSGAEVLELGCGDGRLLGGLAEAGEVRRLVGVDRIAYWDGKGGGVPWSYSPFEGLLSFHRGVPFLRTLETASFDLVLCRELDSILGLSRLDQGVACLYRVMKPGGEAIVRLRCADPSKLRLSGPGFGFMTATAWIHFLQRAGFEVANSRRLWRDDSPAAASPGLEIAELHLHLMRPWEPREFKTLVR